MLYTYRATNLPQDATFNPATGEFNWTPSYEQAGIYNLEIAATDAEGLQSTTNIAIAEAATVEIAVSNVNRTPLLDVQPQIVTLGAGGATIVARKQT